MKYGHSSRQIYLFLDSLIFIFKENHCIHEKPQAPPSLTEECGRVDVGGGAGTPLPAMTVWGEGGGMEHPMET